jgi:hypothetical protein
MAQQTAVDIAFEKLANQGLLITKDYENLVAYRETKEMFKQQIIKAVDVGFDEGCKFPEDIKLVSGEQYYKETYGK